MDYINKLLSDLTARLPELEWKINRVNLLRSSHNVPRGLFRSTFELNGASCIEEIQEDIQALSEQKNERCAHYLASRIKQKINVLVTLCQIDNKKNKPEEKKIFGVKMLGSRQQWIQDLESDIHILVKQQEAISKALEQMKLVTVDAVAILNVKKELGEVEKRLTLANETLNQAISKSF